MLSLSWILLLNSDNEPPPILYSRGRRSPLENLKRTSSPRTTGRYSWVNKFKLHNSIRQRKVTRYIKSRNALDLPTILRIAEEFQKTTSTIIPNFNPDFVLNTDQSSCEYRMNIQRVLSHKREKMTEVFLGDVNKVTHSYTVQYTISASGKLLPKVFFCLQEAKGTFGPRVATTAQNLTHRYKNVYLTASKSGKFTKSHFMTFLTNVMKECCGHQKFLLLLDSWGGQTDLQEINSIFTDEEGNCSSQIAVIPPHCTPFCQPLDVYFFRQMKNFIKKIQNSIDVLQKNEHLSSREDAIKIHSLIHHQLSAPIFEDMIKYAWFASKLILSRSVFANVNEVCFPTDLRRSNCRCSKSGFIKCAACRNILCFECFYDQYHPESCR